MNNVFNPEEALKRASTLSDTWGSKGFTFEVDPTTGRTSISNTDATRAAVGLPVSTSPSFAGGGDSLTANLRTNLASIMEMANPADRLAAFADMERSVSQTKAQIFSETLKQQEAKLGIPKLEQLLMENEAADRAHPMWAQMQSDSQQTAMVRQQLLTARQYADNEAKNSLTGNLTYAGLDSGLKAAALMLQRMDQQDARREAKVDTREQNFEYWKAQRDYMTQLEEERVLQSLRPDQIVKMTQLYPELNGHESIEIARATMRIKDKDTQAVLAATDSNELLALSMLGNTKAETVFLKEEAAAAGVDETLVKQDLAEMRKLMSSKQELRRAAAAIGGKELADQLAVLDRTALTNKEAKAESDMAKFNVAKAYIQKKKQAQFLADAGTWGIAEPEFLAAVGKSKELTGKADPLDVMGAYVGELKGPELVAKEREFYRLLMQGAAAKKGALGSVDPIAVRTQVEAAAAQKRIESNAMNRFSSSLYW